MWRLVQLLACASLGAALKPFQPLGFTAPLTLHAYEHCQFCTRTRLVLGWAGVEHACEFYGYGDGADPSACEGKGYNAGGGPVPLAGKKRRDRTSSHRAVAPLSPTVDTVAPPSPIADTIVPATTSSSPILANC
jgi:hypothetical protein